MKVIAFVGPSGTGKSHHALVVAHDHQIECLIDDGILIYRNRIIAGRSAKEEENRLKAVRCAVFNDPKQAAEVRQALEKIAPERLLILGTSEHMAKKITAALQLPDPEEYIHIEDISTPEEISKARHIRIREGKHVIPVPTMELRSHFKGYLLDPLRSFFHKKNGQKVADRYERSVVRPVFSYYGKLTFTDEVLQSLIRHGTKKVPGITMVNRVKVDNKGHEGDNGLNIGLAVTVLYGENIKKIMNHLKRQLQTEIEYTTGMSVDVLKVSVHGVSRRKARS